MAFADDVSLNDGTGAVSYSLISVVDSKSLRRVSGSYPDNNRELSISHLVGKGPFKESNTRHLARLDRVATNTVTGAKGLLSMYCFVVVPQGIDSDINDVAELMRVELIALMSAGNLVKLLNGEP